MTPQKPLLPVAVDAMGADFGPQVIVQGVVEAVRREGISCILVGRQEQLRACLRALDLQESEQIQIEHADEEVSMHDSPAAAIRSKSKSSIRVAFELVKQGRASGVVSAGNTGAMMAAGLFVVGVLPGIVRPAIASLLPREGTNIPSILLDSGANVDCNAKQILQFALMGDQYARRVIHCDTPRIALLSNGAESSKGNDVTRSAASMLSEMSDLNFVGYVEGRDISKNVADVIVCDGFVGNVLLKTMEGSVELVINAIKGCADTSWLAKLGLWLAKPSFRRLFEEKFDPSSYGGAPLLGLRKTAIVCHGSSNAKAIYNAIRVAQTFEAESLIEKVEGALGPLNIDGLGDYEDGMWNRVGQKLEKKPRRPVEVQMQKSDSNE